MRTGQLIRKVTINGTPYGPYLRIFKFKNPVGLYAQYVLCPQIKVYLKREKVYAPKTAKFVVSDYIFERVRTGIQIAIIHDETPKWKELLQNKAELIQLRSEKYPDKTLVFIVDDIQPFYDRRLKRVRLTLGEQIA